MDEERYAARSHLVSVQAVDGEVWTAWSGAAQARNTEICSQVPAEARSHSGNLQALPALSAFPLRIFKVEPENVHDRTAARIHALAALHAAAAQGLPPLADPGHEGAGHSVFVPAKQPTGGQHLARGGENFINWKFLRTARSSYC